MNWKSLLEKSFVPYSSNAEACIIESQNGKFYRGVRIENISYPLTIPATQAACSICLSEGEIPSKIYLQKQNVDQLNFWIQEFDLQVIETESISDIQTEVMFQNAVISDSLEFLKQLLNKAVVPASDFPVSVLLHTNNGFFTGVNVEVSDWTKGLCAERVALAKAICHGFKDFTSLEIHTRKGEVSSPCGACRQVLLEHLPYHPIKLYHADGTLSEHMSVDLLPFSFKSSTLKE